MPSLHSGAIAPGLWVINSIDPSVLKSKLGSTFCISCITAKIWLNMTITISTVRITCHHSLKNRAVVEYLTDKLISKLLYYKYRLLIPLQHIRMSHKTCITQHYIATSILRYSWSTVSQYNTQSLYRYIVVLIHITDPYALANYYLN